MSEFIGLGYYAEIPGVFFDVQRTGPSTGMPTRTQQGDLLTAAYASHGDTRHIVLFPCDPRECFEFAVRSFDLAERFQTPVFVLSDLDIGMNDWVVPALEWNDDYRPDRGKVLGAEELERMDRFFRYLDSDGDGVPYRTLPGIHPKGAYFTRGSGHDAHGRYTEDAGPYTEVVDRIDRKIRSAAAVVPEPETRTTSDARYGIITLGGCRSAVLESLARLSDLGIEADFMRVRGFPFHESIGPFVERHERTIVVEQNRDGQLRTLLINEAGVPAESLVSVLRYGGMPLSAGQVVEGVLEHLGVDLPTTTRTADARRVIA
jgi:2-oxoglutarate ferredoxin oxidoreductase subunit alpha